MSLIMTDRPSRATTGRWQAGVGMLEVLIALLVLTVGVLGLTAIQASGLKNSRTAYYRTQATVLAYDIIDRMRANSDQMTSSSAYIITLATSPQGTACTSNCTPAAIASTDLIEWRTHLAAQLPQGKGAIQTLAGTN